MSDSFVTLWTIAHQASPTMGFSRQEYWSALPFPSPGDFPDPEIKPMSPGLAGRFFTTEALGKPIEFCRSRNYHLMDVSLQLIFLIMHYLPFPRYHNKASLTQSMVFFSIMIFLKSYTLILTLIILMMP